MEWKVTCPDKYPDNYHSDRLNLSKNLNLGVLSERTCFRTHSWINFRLDLSRASHWLWMLLGEAKSKCEHIAGVPLRPETAQRLYEVYLSKGVHATTSIEGNTLTEEEVQRRIRKDLKLSKSRAYLGTEVDNIVAACRLVAEEVLNEPNVALTPERIREFNHLVLNGLDLDEDTEPGVYRHHSVGVGPYRGAPAEDCPLLVETLCDWLNGPDFRSDDPEMGFALLILKAVLAHLYIAWIHPFGDGNGRTARLVEFQLLVQSGLVPFPAGHVLSNHYNKTRTRYYRELDRSSKQEGGVLAFIQYAVQGFVDELRDQIDYIREQQLQVAWENYVHDQFHGKESASNNRRKHLILDMPEGVVAKSGIPLVSPRVAAEYAGKGDKTLARDVNALETMGLLRRVAGGYVANRDRILAFLPPKRGENVFPLESP